MNKILNTITKNIEKLLFNLKKQPKTKYLSTFLTYHLSPLQQIESIEIPCEKLIKIEDSIIELLKIFNKLLKADFFDSFGKYKVQSELIESLLIELNRIYQNLPAEFQDHKKKIALNIDQMNLIDEAISESKKKAIKTFKIQHEFTYILLNLKTKSLKLNSSILDIDAEEQKESPINLFILDKSQFISNWSCFVKALQLQQEFSSSNFIQKIIDSFKNPDKIKISYLDDYFDKFLPFLNHEVLLKVLSKDSLLKIQWNSYQIQDMDPVPLNQSYVMRFGREVAENNQEIDFFINKDPAISRKQFEIQLTVQGANIKCFSKFLSTYFLIDNTQKYGLDCFTMFKLGEDQLFYVYETHETPVEDSTIPFEGGAYIVVRAIGLEKNSEHKKKKILIKLDNCKVNVEKDDYFVIKTLEKKGTNSFCFGKDLEFVDKAVGKKHARIGYDEKIGWFIEGGYDLEKSMEFMTRVLIYRYNDSNGIETCRPRKLKKGRIIGVEHEMFLVKKIR